MFAFFYLRIMLLPHAIPAIIDMQPNMILPSIDKHFKLITNGIITVDMAILAEKKLAESLSGFGLPQFMKGVPNQAREPPF